MSEPNGNKRDIWNDIHNYPQNTFPTTTQQTQGSFYVNQDQFISANNNAHQQSPSPPGNFTMLAVGHGNYLKVYHNSDETMNYNNYELFSNKSFVPLSINKNTQSNENNSASAANDGVATSTSMFINQLVGNWTPNVSGTYSPFGETMILPENANKFSGTSNTIETPIPDIGNSQKTQKTLQADKVKTNEIKKPRIVAEVKPMRMSYSDVLSQNVSINKNDTINQMNSNNGIQINNNIFNTNNNNNNNNNTNTPVKTIKMNEKNKPNTTSTNINSVFDKKLTNNNMNNNTEEKENNIINKINKKTLNINTKNDINPINLYNIDKEKKNSIINDEDIKDNDSNDIDVKNNNNKKKLINKTNKMKNKAEINQMDKNKKKLSTSHQDDDYYDDDEDDNDDDDEDDDDIDEESENRNFYYNVTKTTGPNENHIEKILKPVQHLNKRNKTSGINIRTANKYEKSSYNKRNQKSRRNRKYAFLVKILETWLEYMIKVLTWFMSLISDVVFLSCGIFWDRMKLSFTYVCQGYRSIKTELKNNSGMPTNWLKKIYKKFDSKFSKTSKLAFWRKLFHKKKLPEPVSDFYKNGRLPQTGDEAMYSLLNCKGKDAYSILGVSPECTQEQIRKHYKKIAVLVHPDKNKQAGAEEAFKILQRAFELIGEPENRKAYDQSVAEVLNAEKAWSELNDLLAQLHTKIAEAANTIRCSSCGLRHPRKPTGRPHYAARECNSCKIRHSAREGDIWAETSIFGLRWKYLALMEGTVYDITEWANCQKGALSHLQPNSHIVQYRIVLGGQQLHSDKEKVKKNTSQNEPNLDDFLNNLYGGSNQQPQSSLRRRKK